MSLFNSGRVGRSNLEKIADSILWLPRRVWVGRSIHVIQNNEDYIIKKNQKSKSLTSWIGEGMSCDGGTGLVLVSLAAFYILTCITALPLLLIGLPLKKISLNSSEKAKCYGLLVKQALQLTTTEEKINSTNKKIKALTEKIKNNNEVLEAFKNVPSLDSNIRIKTEHLNIENEQPKLESQIKEETENWSKLEKRFKRIENELKSTFEKYRS